MASQVGRINVTLLQRKHVLSFTAVCFAALIVRLAILAAKMEEKDKRITLVFVRHFFLV